jgi:hypothetical protein
MNSRRPSSGQHAKRFTLDTMERRLLLATVSSVVLKNGELFPGVTHQSLLYTLTDPVAASALRDALQLHDLARNATIPVSQLASTALAGNQVRISWPGLPANATLGSPAGVLSDGHYDAVIEDDLIGQPISEASEHRFGFYRGDIDGDLYVGFSDLLILAQNYGPTPASYAQGDLDYDGVVGFSDLLILSQKYNTSLTRIPIDANSLSVGSATASSGVLNWTVPIDPATELPSTTFTGFRIWRSTDGTDFGTAPISNDADPALQYIPAQGIYTWTDTGLQDGTKYWYRVRPYNTNASNGAPLGNWHTTNKTSLVTVLPGPTNLVARAAGPTMLDLSWRDNSRFGTEFQILRSTDGGASFAAVGTTTVSFFRDTGGAPSSSYLYRVVVKNAVTASGFVGTTSVTTTAASPVSTLSMSAGGIDSLHFSWTPVPDASQYHIEASYDGVDFEDAPISVRPAWQTSGEFIRAEFDSAIFVRIGAWHGNMFLGYSNVASSSTSRAASGTPFLTSAERTGDTATFAWTPADSYADHFVVQRSVNGSAFSDLAIASFDADFYIDADLKSDMINVTYRVQAASTFGDSAFSTEAVALPPAVQSLENIPRRSFLVTFYGADPFDPDSEGNIQFLRNAIHLPSAAQYSYETLNPNPGTGVPGDPYRDFNGVTAFTDLLDAVDFNDDNRIDSAEVAAVDVRLLGWSLGGVEAIQLSRWLGETGLRSFASWIGYRLEVPIPVQDLIAIDAVHDGGASLLLRFPHGPVPATVGNFVHYYQRRGESSIMQAWQFGTYPSSFFRLPDLLLKRSDILGIDLRGRPTRSNAAMNRQEQVEVAYSLFGQQHEYVTNYGSGVPVDGLMVGGQVNHRTIVWWAQDLVREELA